NKKRGRNITIGAVVGMLLSCTVVTGATIDVKAKKLEITKDINGKIEFKNESGDPFTPENEDANNPYSDNNWSASTNTYTNNSVISGKNGNESPDSNVYEAALKVTAPEINLVNNGVIKEEVTVTMKYGYGYGICIDSDLTGNLTNNGEITASGTFNGYGIYSNKGYNGNLINDGAITGFGTNSGHGIYTYLDFNGNLTNNGEISGSGTYSVSDSKPGGYGFGIYIDSGLNGNLINNGEISGTGTSTGTGTSNGLGIRMQNLKGNLTNNGEIAGTGSTNGYGIYVLNLKGKLTNNGEISGTGTSNGYGIYIDSYLEGELTNNGIITATGSASVYGIYIDYELKLTGNLTNNGTITASGTNNVYGIYKHGNSSSNGKLTNTGVIYGSTNAIKIEGGTLNDLYNYGLLVTGNTIINDSTKVKNMHKYGLAFKVDGTTGNYSATDDDFSNFGTISTEGEYTVVNAKAKNNNANDIGGTESLTLEKGTLSYLNSEGNKQTESISPDKKYVFNGIENTLKVSGKHNKLNNSRVNAYGTAVVMDEGNSILTLDNTVVNGGMKEDTTTISITENGSALTVKGDSVINVRDGGTAITVTGSDNAVVLKGNTIVNGKMEANGERNILDLDGTGKDGMNMHHDISGFAKMNIDNNVTFSEDMKVTGTTEVTVEGTGVLNLRLKKDSGTPTLLGDTPSAPSTATHAFSGTGGMTIEGSGEGGTLNFITNGIGRVIDVDMEKITLENMKIKASSIIDKAEIHGNYIRLGAGSALGEIVNPKEVKRYGQLDKIYKSIYSSREENLDGLRDILSLSTYLGKNYDYNNRIEAEKEEQLASLLGYLTSVYIESPYSYSSELSRRSMGMFRDIVTENEFRPNLNNWLIMGGLTHADGGTKGTYYGQNYHEIDGGTAETSTDMKLTGAYMLAKYGYSENTSLGLTLGGNKSESEMSTSKVKGNSGYLGAFAENYRGNLTLKAGAGVQYSEYDADRRTTGDSYSDKYSDMAYDIYLNGRYSNPMGDNLFLEPYATLSYTYIDQDGADEGNKTLAIETDSKSFDYTVGKVGVDLKKVIPHEKGKSTLSAGVSYTKILDGADEEYITGRFKGGSDFDILVA
ncbi:autotransporter outer membrane beta-barrel domain-containing protein, partial [Fusobacterium ulcerans]|uniref:autotransporter outer membrane beta-barrel domain-containing protein n=2 Tax=Fusobacterium ulcerans TaxID=861 RepID=UPI0029CAC6EB